jgi:ankyrin repeat protein
MKKLLVLTSFVALSVFAFSLDAKTQTKSLIEEAELRTASAKAIRLIQHSQTAWYKKQVCTSCHHQLVPEITLKLARERGVPINEAVAQEMTKAAFAPLNDLDTIVQGYDYIDVFFDSWVLLSASRAGLKPTLATAAYAQFIAARQQPDGSWPTIDSRPPQAHSPFAATAVGAEAMRQYLPARFKGEQETRLRQARAWLLKAQPRTTEDRTFQLLGLLWTGADIPARQKAAQQLVSEQRTDGGWSQLPALASDAYSTGAVLFALHEGARIKTSDPAYQRGLRFMLNNQQPDGSWHVTSRLHPPAPLSPPYVDTEFPTGHDQFISILGTSWAVTALLQALPIQTKSPAPPALATIQQAAEQPAWVPVALNGNVAELKTLLDDKLSPNAKTAAGTTTLMLAARDVEKVKLLLARGADVNARAATGITALLIAARYKGNAEVVRLLLQKGAKPNADGEVRNNASALFYAAMAGDVQTAEALISAGAKLESRMNVLGLFPAWPLTFATLGNEARFVEFLLGKGAKVDDVDADGLSALSWAVLTNHVETLQVLLARGAEVNRVDNFGMTPLLYAASIDFGDTAVLEKLIAAGANVQAKNKQGQTAFELAKAFNHNNAARLLSSKIASKLNTH